MKKGSLDSDRPTMVRKIYMDSDRQNIVKLGSLDCEWPTTVNKGALDSDRLTIVKEEIVGFRSANGREKGIF